MNANGANMGFIRAGIACHRDHGVGNGLVNFLIVEEHKQWVPVNPDSLKKSRAL